MRGLAGLLYDPRIDVSSILKTRIDQVVTIIGRFTLADESDDDPDYAGKRRQHREYDRKPKPKSIDRCLSEPATLATRGACLACRPSSSGRTGSGRVF